MSSTPRKPRARRRRKGPLCIGGRTIEPGRTTSLHLDCSESYTGLTISLPIHVVAAPRPGPTVFVTALIHGDELNGLGIIHDLCFERPLPLLRGTVVAAPVVNVFGLESYSRYLPDRRDLNRSFPGRRSGSLTSRLAHLLFTEIIRHCDVGIDLHTAAVRRTNYPNIRADLDDPRVTALARVFGCELLVHSKGAAGSLRRTAVKHGIPTIVLEAGEVWKIEPGVVELGVRGIQNVLRHLRMLPGPRSRPAYQRLIRRSAWIRAEAGGVLTFHAKPGEVVRKGQTVATHLGILGQVKDRIVSPWDGVVLGMTTMPVVKPGEPVYHLAIPDEPIEGIARRIQQRDQGALHTRIQRDLATNITLRTARRHDPAAAPVKS